MGFKQGRPLLYSNLFKARRFSKMMLVRAIFLPVLLILPSKFKGSSRTIRSISQSSDLVTFQICCRAFSFFRPLRMDGLKDVRGQAHLGDR